MKGWLLKLADAVRDRGRRRFWSPEQASGRRAEDLAHRFLRRRGMLIVARNYRPPFGGGEIDLIGWDGAKLAIVEVKSRATAGFGGPERAVDEDKERFLERAAHDYARRAGVDWNCVRFDIVSVVLERPTRVVHFADAFQPRRTL